MKVYVLMCWIDGFGNDTEILGVYESLEKIYELHSEEYLSDCKYQKIEMNKIVNIDYEEGIEFEFKSKNKQLSPIFKL